MSPTGSAAPIVVALVGYGYWGPNLLRNYMELPEATVKWVCDRRPEALPEGPDPLPGGRRHRRSGRGARRCRGGRGAGRHAHLHAFPLAKAVLGRQARLRREAHDGRHR